jgi:hypothetical protein
MRAQTFSRERGLLFFDMSSAASTPPTVVESSSDSVLDVPRTLKRTYAMMDRDTGAPLRYVLAPDSDEVNRRNFKKRIDYQSNFLKIDFAGGPGNPGGYRPDGNFLQFLRIGK